MARTASADGPVLVLGDLNIWGGAPDRADPSSEYNQLMQALNAAVAPRRFVDLWLATHPDDPETDSGTKPRVLADGSLRPREKRIDFCSSPARSAHARSPCAATSCRALWSSTASRWATSSNHAALLAEIAWRPRADPLTAAAEERQSRP